LAELLRDGSCQLVIRDFHGLQRLAATQRHWNLSCQFVEPEVKLQELLQITELRRDDAGQLVLFKIQVLQARAVPELRRYRAGEIG